MDMDRYIAKEREEAVKKARERRRAEILVGLQTDALESPFACSYHIDILPRFLFHEFCFVTDRGLFVPQISEWVGGGRIYFVCMVKFVEYCHSFVKLYQMKN